MFEIRLVITRDGDAYTGRWTGAAIQESAPFPLALPLSESDAAELRWYLEEYLQWPGPGDHVKAEKVERRLKAWGRALFAALFGAAGSRDVYHDLMDAVRAGERGVITLGSDDPAVLVQPWEMARDSRGPLAVQGVTVRRQLRGAGRGRRFDLRLPLRVLLIVSRPQNIDFIDPRNSARPVLDALDALPPDAVIVEFCEPPTLGRLEELISQARKAGDPYHVVHFDGHGAYLPLTGVGALAFEDDDAQTFLAPGTQLGDLLVRLEVPIVLLEACRSSDLSDRPVFGSVAPALLESGVGSVVAFSHAVHITAARLLVERFYRELVGGETVGRALEEGRACLIANTRREAAGLEDETIDLQDWFIPQLYQVGDDPVLIETAVSRQQPATSNQPPAVSRPPTADSNQHPVTSPPPPAPLATFPSPPVYGFHGRALELLELKRALRRHPAVVVSGMGGMGKTALAREAAAWWLRQRRFTHAVFVSFEQGGGAQRVIDALGEALEGVSFARRPADEQRATAVAWFREHPVLLVWDNFESTLPAFQRAAAAEDEDAAAGAPVLYDAAARAELRRLYDALTEDAPRGRLLVTCRPTDAGLPGIRTFSLAGLKRRDSRELLAAALDRKGIRTDREGYEREEIDALLAQLDDHPLSIALVGPHLADLAPQAIRETFTDLLARFADAGAAEGRNRSLLASLAFSRRRLSAAAQAVLPYLAWFTTGVFEANLLDFIEISPDAWEPIRAELLATALIAIEDVGITLNDRPYLRFHPTLPYAAHAGEAGDPGTEARFIAVYRAVQELADDALFGRQPAAGMALVAREEANLRRALRLAYARGDRDAGWRIADTLRVYLQRAGRLRERDVLAAWARAQTPKDALLDVAACNEIRQHAWARFTQGEVQAQAAAADVQALIARLETGGLADAGDATFQIALSYRYLGQIFVNAHRPALALAPAQQAIARFETLPGQAAQANLSAALGDLANAHLQLGDFDAALAAAERALALSRELGRDREMAAGLLQIAAIMVQQQRYAEAEARYAEALDAARRAGDLGLQGITLQHLGILHWRQGQPARAVVLYREALALFRRANALGDEMRTCDLLATAEQELGRLDASEAWYARSRELALALGDRAQQAATAHNLGILYQQRAEASAEPATRERWLRRAASSVQESLYIKVEMRNQLGAAASESQLGKIHRLLGDLDEAETHARRALEIREALNHPDVYKDYWILAAIARDRGDAQAAAAWEAKRDAKIAELERLRRGEAADAAGAPASQRARFVLELAQVAYQARQTGVPLPPDAAEALAQLQAASPPLGAVGDFLHAIAAGAPPPSVPPGLPDDLARILAALLDALGE